MAKPSAVSRAQKRKARDSGHDERNGRWRGRCPERALQERNAEAHHASRGRTARRCTSKGGAAARSTGTPTRPRTTKPHEAAASLLTPRARDRWGGGVKRARTNEEALRPEAARPTTTARAAQRAADERDKGSVRSAEAAQNQRDPARFMTAPQQPRGACRPRRRLRETTAKTNSQRGVEACVSEQRDLCRRRPK